jgi:uracil-DNA glycosylase
MNLELVEKTASSCTLCNLCNNRKMPVFSRGNMQSDVMIVGMVPGPEENEVGLPFVGRAGKCLDMILEDVSVDLSSVYITNTVKCALAPGIPLKEEWIDACMPFLVAQIYLINPSVIITLGSDATNAVLGFPLDTKIGDSRHYVHYYSDQISVVATYHPSYLIRGGGRQHKQYNEVLYDFTIAFAIKYGRTRGAL